MASVGKKSTLMKLLRLSSLRVTAQLHQTMRLFVSLALSRETHR